MLRLVLQQLWRCVLPCGSKGRGRAQQMKASGLKGTSKRSLGTRMQPFEYRSVRYWSKESNGTRTGGRKINFLIRGRGAAQVNGGRAG